MICKLIQSLGIEGYLDIGLIDTMHDLIIAALGTLIFFVYVIIDRDRHPMISNLPKKEKKILSYSIFIKIKNKSLNPIGKQPSMMSKIMQIAFDNKSPMIINEDVLILGSSDKLRKDLRDIGIKFTVEDEKQL